MKDTAVVTYIDDNQNLINEFGWLHRSWRYSGSDKTSQLIAFYNPTIEHEKLPDDPDIVYIPSEPLTYKEHKWSGYPFINSVYFLTTPEAAKLAEYKYILCTDNDCFLTPNFPNLRPRLATFGIGLYAQVPEVVIRLAQIAEKWDILPQFNSIGSTFIACADLALQFKQLHMEYCRRLLRDEFTAGVGQWPGWFMGVLTMYAGNLAANAFFGTGLVMGGLDCHCMAQAPMCSTDYHIHAWHTYDYFSKFHWRNGEYKDVDMTKLNPNIIADYCLLVAGAGPCE